MDFLVTLVIGPDVYARENALGALYSVGNQEAVLAQWEKMEDNGILHSVKLLADGLLGFAGIDMNLPNCCLLTVQNSVES